MSVQLRFVIAVLGLAILLPHAGAAVEGQPTGRLPLVAQLSPRAAMSADDTAFRSSLAERGYHEGRNIAFAFRGVAGDPKGLEQRARELVQLRPVVLFAAGSEAAHAAMAATDDIPIVF